MRVYPGVESYEYEAPVFVRDFYTVCILCG